MDSAARVVVGGEALVDLVPERDDAGAAGRLVPRWGGGPYNTAIALGRLGVPTALLSRLSTDGFGAALLARLLASDVSDRLVQRGPEPTSLAVVTLSEQGSAGYSFYVQGTADRLVTDPGPLPDGVAAVALGTLGTVLEPGATVYENVLHREAAAGRLISLDPNIRPALLDDPDAHRRRLTSWLPHVGLLKISEEDADWWGGTPGDWLDAGATAVVITRGMAGLGAQTRAAGWVQVPAAPARPFVDTIGAGDSVHAALLAWLHEAGCLSVERVAALAPDQWRQALNYAARVAALTCSRSGAEPPTRAELAPGP
jgi:fructokinase